MAPTPGTHQSRYRPPKLAALRERESKFNFLRDLFYRIFCTHYRHPKNSCKLFEYLIHLTKIIKCEWLSGCAFAFRREVFNEFKFDENPVGYSFMEEIPPSIKPSKKENCLKT